MRKILSGFVYLLNIHIEMLSLFVCEPVILFMWIIHASFSGLQCYVDAYRS